MIELGCLKFIVDIPIEGKDPEESPNDSYAKMGNSTSSENSSVNNLSSHGLVSLLIFFIVEAADSNSDKANFMNNLYYISHHLMIRPQYH